MKQFITILFLFLFSYSAFTQNTQTNDWVRVQSDNGEFSIEIPQKHNYFFSDKEIASRNNTKLNNVNLITGFFENTLVSFESYQEGKSFLEDYLDFDKHKIGNEKISVSKFILDGVEIKQLEKSDEYFYMIRQYIPTKKNVYIITVASRSGKTTTMQKFLKSAILKKDSTTPTPSIELISNLPKTKIEIVTNGVKPLDNSELPNTQSIAQRKADKSIPLTIIRPRAYFTEVGRGTSGTIYLRINCLDTGFVNKIEVVKGMQNGLTWQAISSVIMSKILPAEVGGNPTAGRKLVSYSFTTY